jgi:tetratricopeptide (TPR) repeat protein
MSTKYLSEFYSLKVKIAEPERHVAGPATALEQQIQAHLLIGNQLYFDRKYSTALSSYLQAWNLLPRIFFPLWSLNTVLLDPKVLMRVDMSAQLAESSTRLLRFRDAAGPKATVAASVQPPRELVTLNREATGASERSELYSSSLALFQSGDLRQSREHAEKALRAAGNDIASQADAHMLLGAVDAADGNLDRAQERLKTAEDLYKKAKRPDAVAAMQHNLAVALTRAGKADEAGKMFASAASRAPFNPGWTVTHSVNPGIAAVGRSFGANALPLMLQTDSGQWSAVNSGAAAEAKTSATVFAGSKPIVLDLTAGPAEIQSKLLQPRIAATSLLDLEIHYQEQSQFVAYLTHIAGFVLPVAIGDTYAALGDDTNAVAFYLKARDYGFLNHAIERPMLWRKVAEVHIHRGNRLFRDRQHPQAQAEFEKILRIRDDGSFELTGPLYSSGFSALAAEHLAFLNSPDKLGFAAIEHSRRGIIMDALGSLTRLRADINYLGFSENVVPLHSWRYLQNVARYFANHASQSERAYISFKETAEREEFTRLALEQAVDAQEAALNVEISRVNAAQEQLDAARVAQNLAERRLANARQQREDFAAISRRLAAIEEIIAFTNATGLDTDIVINQDWASALGLAAPGTFDAEDLIQILTRIRSRLTQKYELANLDRQIKEMEAALAVAQSQVVVAQAMLEVAMAQLEAARLRLDQSQAQLDHFDAQEFTPELWDNLAQAQRQISGRYLDRAIGAAFLMERAFEYDYDTEVNRIRFDYSRSELNGLLAADFLLSDIDAFTYDRILDKKQVPIKVSIALADRYPSQFRDFQQTGKIDFEVLLQDIDLLHPGTYVRKLKRVEIVVEGLIGPRGLHGTLTNSGITYDRSRSGDRKERMQRPETMVLSQFDLRHDGFVFVSDEEVLALFENAGPAGGWMLEFPLDSNDVDFRAITNIHLVVYYDAFYSETIEGHVRRELAATAIFQQSIGLSLRHQFPDEFFALRDSGAVTFTLDSEFIQYNHADARVRDVYLMVQTVPGVSNSGLVVRLATEGGFDAQDTTDAIGVISSAPVAEPLDDLRVPEALDALRGSPLADTWTIEIPRNLNVAAFDSGFAWSRVANIFLMIDYEYTPRGLLSLSENFTSNPMSRFDIVDDPDALTNAPSAWSWNADMRRIEQGANIHNPPGAANMNSAPDKPGTYLVHKTDADWPAFDSFVLRCNLSSGDNDGIGLVFRYQDVDNFYFFLMDSERNYRRLGKKVGGDFRELQTAAVDANGFTVRKEMDVGLVVSGESLKVFLDGDLILSGRDNSISAAGRVGFYSWGNTAARFSSLRIREV